MNPLLKRLLNPGSVCLFVCLILLVLGLWPFDFFPENNVHWVGGPSGLRFGRPGKEGSHEAGGMAFTPKPLFNGKTSEGDSFTLEIRLRTNREAKGGVPGIVVFCGLKKKPSLFLGQWKSSLVARRFQDEVRDGRKWKEAGICNVLVKDHTSHLTISSNRSECIFYVDGLAEKKFPRLSLLPETGSLQGHYLLLGNTPEAAGGWKGDILGLALYDRFLTREEVWENFRSWDIGGRGPIKTGLFLHYDFQDGKGEKVLDRSGKGNDLLIPSHPKFAGRILAPVGFGSMCWKGFAQDIGVNVIGFIPFGFLLCLWLAAGTKAPLPLIAAGGILGGALVSLFIELMQSQIPVRTSSMMDLVANTVGAGVGALLFAVIFLHNRYRDLGFSGRLSAGEN